MLLFGIDYVIKFIFIIKIIFWIIKMGWGRGIGSNGLKKEVRKYIYFLDRWE